ncbi:HAD family phosphatase [Vibrio fluvialis]|nr:HAD family phosphatase [Vibrio fluvialis]
MNFQAAIFDMDGLLLDTERVCLEIFEQACHAVGIPFLRDLYLSVIGRNAAGIEASLRAGYGPDLDYPVLHNEWRTRYNAVVKHQPIPVKQGVIELLQWLKAHQIPTAVATSSQRDVASVKSAMAAKMITYQIPDLVTPSDDVLALGHSIRPSLSHVLDELKANR